MHITLLDNLFIIVATVLGLLSILIMWLFVVENKKGLLVSQLVTYERYANIFYMTSTVLLALIWFCVEGADKKVLIILALDMLAWIISGIVFLIISVIEKNANPQIRLDMRCAMGNAIKKGVILLIITWILNV